MAPSAKKSEDEQPIPQPPPKFLLGNLGDIDPENRMASLTKLFKLYGPIYKLNLGGKMVTFVGSHEIADEICDDERFEKMVTGPLFEVRAMTGPGQHCLNISSFFSIRSDQPFRSLHCLQPRAGV